MVDEPVREHAIGEPRLAAGAAGAMKCRLHRRGRNPVRVDDPGLDREHDRDRARNRDDPVDCDPPVPRQALGEPVNGIARAVPYRLGGGKRRRRRRVQRRGRLRVRGCEASVCRVELSPARRIGQQLVRVLDLAEMRRRPRRLAFCSMEANKTPVRVSNLLRRRVRADAEYLVGGAHRRALRRVHPPIVPQGVVRRRLCSRRHSSIFAWSPERRTSGTCQPRNSAGRV